MNDFDPQSVPAPPARNPYAPPEAIVADVHIDLDDLPLAGRGARFLARFVDGLLLFGIVIGSAILLGSVTEGNPDASATVGCVFLLSILLLAVIQITLLSLHGQTIGKKLMGVKIVRLDNSKASGWRLVLLREFIGRMLFSALPLIGFFYGITDALFIFRDDFRCLHDHIGDTKVVLA